MNNASKAFLIGLCIAGSMTIAPTFVSAAVGVDVDIAPPPLRVEAPLPPRAGYVWAPGFWDYRGREHIWVPGRWIGERRGFHWVPDHWEQRGPRYHYVRGHWAR